MDTTRFLNKNQSITIPKYLYDSLRADIIADKRLENLFKELLFEKMRLSEDEFRQFMADFIIRFATTDDIDTELYLPHIRFCSNCGTPMDEGFCIENGYQYFCCEQCLTKHITWEDYLQLYDEGRGDSYWTTWRET